MQWHPERPQFEWLPDRGINHSSSAVQAMQWASFFLNTEINKKYAPPLLPATILAFALHRHPVCFSADQSLANRQCHLTSSRSTRCMGKLLFIQANLVMVSMCFHPINSKILTIIEIRSVSVFSNDRAKVEYTFIMIPWPLEGLRRLQERSHD